MVSRNMRANGTESYASLVKHRNPGKTIRVGKYRYPVIQKLGFNSQENGYAYLVLKDGKPAIAARKVQQPEFTWYTQEEKG